METPSLNKVIKKGTLKSYSAETDTLTLIVPMTDNETDTKVNIEINYQPGELQRQIDEKQAKILEIKKEMKGFQDLLEAHNATIVSGKAAYELEKSAIIDTKLSEEIL